jgi:hypothetical protein
MMMMMMMMMSVADEELAEWQPGSADARHGRRAGRQAGKRASGQW